MCASCDHWAPYLDTDQVSLTCRVFIGHENDECGLPIILSWRHGECYLQYRTHVALLQNYNEAPFVTYLIVPVTWQVAQRTPVVAYSRAPHVQYLVHS